MNRAFVPAKKKENSFAKEKQKLLAITSSFHGRELHLIHQKREKSKSYEKPRAKPNQKWKSGNRLSA